MDKVMCPCCGEMIEEQALFRCDTCWRRFCVACFAAGLDPVRVKRIGPAGDGNCNRCYYGECKHE